MEEYRQLVLLPLIRYSHGNFKVTRRILNRSVIVSVSVKERMSFGIVENKIQTKAFILLVGQNFATGVHCNCNSGRQLWTGSLKKQNSFREVRGKLVW